MTDYTELKRLAEAAQASCIETGQRWPEADDWFEPDLISEEMDFVKGASPVVVLALIAENQRLRKEDLRAGLMALAAYIGPICTAAVVAAMGKGEQS